MRPCRHAATRRRQQARVDPTSESTTALPVQDEPARPTGDDGCCSAVGRPLPNPVPSTWSGLGRAGSPRSASAGIGGIGGPSRPDLPVRRPRKPAAPPPDPAAQDAPAAAPQDTTSAPGGATATVARRRVEHGAGRFVGCGRCAARRRVEHHAGAGGVSPPDGTHRPGGSRAERLVEPDGCAALPARPAPAQAALRRDRHPRLEQRPRQALSRGLRPSCRRPPAGHRPDRGRVVRTGRRITERRGGRLAAAAAGRPALRPPPPAPLPAAWRRGGPAARRAARRPADRSHPDRARHARPHPTAARPCPSTPAPSTTTTRTTPAAGPRTAATTTRAPTAAATGTTPTTTDDPDDGYAESYPRPLGVGDPRDEDDYDDDDGATARDGEVGVIWRAATPPAAVTRRASRRSAALSPHTAHPAQSAATADAPAGRPSASSGSPKTHGREPPARDPPPRPRQARAGRARRAEGRGPARANRRRPARRQPGRRGAAHRSYRRPDARRTALRLARRPHVGRPAPAVLRRARARHDLDPRPAAAVARAGDPRVPVPVGLGWWFTRTAERVEQDFADHIQDS